MNVDERATEAALRDLYARTYPRLVAVVGLVAGSRQDAEEVVQDAFLRLIPRWSTVSAYDNPEAWLRKVALGNLSNTRRKARNGMMAFRRHGSADPVPGPSGDRVDLARALARLPRQQREVVVLQHLGLDTAAIASELDIPLGTVKSRLSRARAALQPLLQEDALRHV